MYIIGFYSRINVLQTTYCYVCIVGLTRGLTCKFDRRISTVMILNKFVLEFVTLYYHFCGNYLL